MDYIAQKMATVGCGVSDTKELEQIVSSLTQTELDILDCWYNLGRSVKLLPELQSQADNLNAKYTDDDIDCISTYVSASRNIA